MSMGKFATMILWGSVKLAVSVAVSLFLIQTCCLYFTAVFAEFQANMHQERVVPHSHIINPLVLNYEVDHPDMHLLKESEQGNEKGRGENKVIVLPDFLSQSLSTDLTNLKESNDVVESDHENTFKSESVELDRLEKKLLSLFGMTSRPKSGTRKRAVPRQILDIFEKQRNSNYVTTDLFLPGKLTQNANTVRIFNPTGRYTTNF